MLPDRVARDLQSGAQLVDGESALMAQGYGEEQPMVPNDDERMRELNPAPC